MCFFRISLTVFTTLITFFIVNNIHAQAEWPKLSQAAWESMNAATIQSLVNQHSIRARDDMQKTALMYAAQYTESIAVHEYLLAQGADVNARDALGISVLFWGILNPNIEILTLLLNSSANFTHRDSMGRQAQMIAAAYGSSPSHLRTLLRAGLRISAVDAQGRTALMHAVSTNSDVRMTETLLRYGADIYAVDKNNNSVFFYAARLAQSPDIIRLLIANNAQLHTKNNDGETALHLAAATNSEARIIQELIDQGAGLNEKDTEGRTPLMMAAAYNSTAEVVFTLVNAGSDITQRSKAGKTAWNFLQKNRKLRDSESYARLRGVLLQ